MPSFNQLGLTNDAVGENIDYANIPDQMGTFTEPPQPGAYRFKFPADMSQIWDTRDHAKGKPPGKRVVAKFDEAHPLTIIQSPNGTRNGEPFITRLDNAERKRGKKEDTTAPMVSDFDYFFRDVWGLASKPQGGNIAQAQEFSKHVNGEFGATVTWSWSCRDDKPIFVDNGQGGLTEVPTQLGCGARYYEKDVPKALSNPQDPTSAKVFPLRITCQCGGNVRAFANLQNFQP